MDKYIEMPVCEDVIPIKFGCAKCSTDTLDNTIKKLQVIVEDASSVKDLFYRKLHELKKIDEARDDVINVLCQKIEAISHQLNELKEKYNADTR